MLVTGAAAGVGKGVAEAFGAAGAVVGLGVRVPAKAAEVAANVEALGGTPVVLRATSPTGPRARPPSRPWSRPTVASTRWCTTR